MSEDHCCSSNKIASNPSVYQTLDELDFERGVWSAALNGEVKKVEQYLNNGGDPDIKDSSGYTALHYAARHSRFTVCELLVNYKANVNVQTKSGGVTPLQRASYQGNIQVVELLLHNGADVKLADSDGCTALHKAAEKANIEISKCLVQKEPYAIQIRDNRGRLPFDLIPSHMHTKFVHLKPD